MGGFGVALLLHPPKSDEKNVEEMFRKCSTAQSFIRTEMNTYRIGTLSFYTFQFLNDKIDKITNFAKRQMASFCISLNIFLFKN